jgi:hypothetical protein
MMKLEKVRDMLRAAPNSVGHIHLRAGDCADMADAIDAHMSQPQPVAQGEVVACAEVVTDPSTGNRLVVTYFANGVTPEVGTKLYTIPTGHRVVPVSDTEDMDNVWIGSRFLHLLEVARKVPGWTGEDVAEGCCTDQEFNDAIEHVDRAIGNALLAASPSAGGV